MTKEEFISACKQANITLTEKQIHQFELYKDLLLEWNEKMNLTAITKEEEIWEKHFYDSIYPFFNCEINSMCDVGSGAGFPGIPVKIVFDSIHLTIVEPLQKRCRFLEEVKKQLHLENVEIKAERAEDFVKNHREQYDLVSARAVAKLSILLELCVPLVKVNGLMVALKGKNGKQELEEAQKAVSILSLDLEKEEIFHLDDEATRMNFYFRKKKSTPLKYPRAYGQIKKKPLGE
ncbi:16S rRNA (guanine(527)-N(7))-methyltransferase RsmG [Floccifex sp.]|uniref:16S rRNA (guanine(527)-N(7))-methyltransferase RsmG n=1 Tax=Floccifex sp. TaxID=2815810 RepID=UPI002A75F2A9|nr:16S rRNA (guanine(527)-N(7))-methyltransferase RsmG [Floccifex sp.]MDD7280579.1 16S rRNA (guanine(527)-N(7))-methyltransferase RsmG [Erysipelotrichaceae bacterium]MDY2958646.1 16S rRNA (guanine(527)-N(7))-methyltransferase RsmG [Floccifex sp.]